MRRNYTTDRTVAVVVGRFDPAKAIDLVAKAFSKARSAKEPNARKNDSFSPPIAEISASKDVQQTQLAIGYRTFGVNDERKYAATLMDVILGRGMSSRLFQEIREKRGLSYDIASRLQFFSDTGMFTITGGLDGSKVQLAMKTIDRELKKIRTKKVPAAELRRAKEFLIGNFRLGHERITSKLFFYGSILLSFGKIVTIEEQVDSLRAVTADDIISVANDIIRPEMRSVSFVVPK